MKSEMNEMRHSVVSRLAAVIAVGVIPATAALAMFLEPEKVPVTRLIAMTEKVLSKNPQDAAAHYMLARIHYLAFASGARKLDAYMESKQKAPAVGDPFLQMSAPNAAQASQEAQRRTLSEMGLKKVPESETAFAAYRKRLGAIEEELARTGWHPGKDLPDAEAIEHLNQAAQHFEEAIKLSRENALYRLGSACLMEQALEWRRRHPQAQVPEFVAALSPADVRKGYAKVWETELAADLKDKERRGAFSPMDMVSYEAGTAYVRLAELGRESLSKQEKATLGKVRNSLKDLEKGTMNTITPVIFSVRSVRGIDELLAPCTVVEFPLSGWGPARRWPWVKPDTAILVWNPSRSGRVNSGAQLFGNYTWELFWNNGYEPLAVLDSDETGDLSGQELDGLAAWFDRNGNGISESGEVVPLPDLGVASLATNAASSEGVHPMNPRGVTFCDGRTLPSWDWIAEPIGDSKTLHHADFLATAQ